VRLDTQAGGGAWRHPVACVEVGLRDAAHGVEELGGVGVGEVGPALVAAGGVAEGLPAAPGLLRRPARDADGDASVGEQVEGGDLLGQVERVLVAHVDDAGADLDAPGAGAGRRQQRHGRAKWWTRQ